MNKKWSIASAFLAVLLVATQKVEAELVYTDTVLVSGSEFLQTYEMPFDAPGSYRITATDMRWPAAELAALSFGVFTATESLATRSGAGALEFFMTGPGRVFLQLYARTAGPEYAGLVAIQGETVAVVPLPASLVLLLSALGAAALPSLGRRARELMGGPEPMPTAV